MIIELPLHDSQWTAFVEERPDALPMHHPAWASLLSECYGLRAFALVLTEADKVVAGIPVVEVARLGRSRWISLPFTDRCPPLVDADRAPRLISDLDRLRRHARVSRLEIRGAVAGTPTEREAAWVGHSLRLRDDPDAVARGFRPSVRRNIRTAEKSGVEVRPGDSERDLATTFYRLHVETRRRLGVPVQPRRFFRLLWRRIIQPGLGFLLLAYDGNVPVAGAVFLTWNGTLDYKYGASDPAFWRHRPNNLIFWEAIRSGCLNGYRTFDFGRSEEEDESLRRFKLGWGSTEYPLHYMTLGEAQPHAASSGSRVLKPMIQRSPLWVTRALGELLYKYAA